MKLPVTPTARHPHTPLAVIQHRTQTVARGVRLKGEAAVPGRRPVKPITFDSAL